MDVWLMSRGNHTANRVSGFCLGRCHRDERVRWPLLVGTLSYPRSKLNIQASAAISHTANLQKLLTH